MRLATLIALIALPTLSLAETTVIAEEAFFPEGPYVLNGTLLWAEYAGNRVRAWNGTEVTTLWEGEGCGPSAVAPLGDDLAITCYDDGTVARIATDGTDIARYSQDVTGAPLVGPNDFTPDGAGGLWMTASGPWDSAPIVGKVYHLAPDGTLTEVADDLHYANGIAMGTDGRLYVNESEAGRVISFAVDGQSLSDRRLALRIAAVDPESGPGAYPDGLKVGPEGNLWIGQFSSGRIVVAEPDGTPVRVVEAPGKTAPNLTFAPQGGIYVMTVDQTDAAPYRGRVLHLSLD